VDPSESRSGTRTKKIREELPGEETENVFSLIGGGLSGKSDWGSNQEESGKRITIENAEGYAKRRNKKQTIGNRS